MSLRRACSIDRRYISRLMRSVGLVLLLLVLGCGKGGNIVGTWSMNAPFGTMMVNFNADGTYDGNLTGPGASGAVKGTYRVKGSNLEMDPPTISMPNGQSVTPPGGVMRMKMSWKDDRNVELNNGSATFMMTRTQ